MNEQINVEKNNKTKVKKAKNSKREKKAYSGFNFVDKIVLRFF